MEHWSFETALVQNADAVFLVTILLYASLQMNTLAGTGRDMEYFLEGSENITVFGGKWSG